MRPSVLATVLLVVCVTAAADEVTELSAYVQGLREQHDVPGLNAALRLRDGRVITASAGFADVETHTPLTSHTRMPGGSTGKTFVAVTAMQLVEAGRLDLNAPLSTWFDDAPWFDTLPNARDITVAMLLSHTSGLPDHVDDLGFAVNAGWRRLKGDTTYIKPEELIGFLADDDAVFPAGTGYNYTDTGYLIVGLILERVTGHDYYDELRARILEPLALVDAMLVRFYGALAEARIVQPQTLQAMIAPAAGPKRPYGYGVLVFDGALTRCSSQPRQLAG